MQELLSESMRMQDAPSFRTVHDALLAHSASLLQLLPSAPARRAALARITSAYLPAAGALQRLFAAEAARADACPDVLRDAYRAWRRRDAAGAALAWAAWLLGQGRGREAAEVVQRARGEAGEGRMRLEEGWRAACDAAAAGRGREEDAMVLD